MERRTTFTKRDVLVFLGCVIFLLASLGAVGAGGRRLAKEMLCLSNLKEWGNCFSLYTGDNDGYFGTGASSKYEKWFNYLRPYYSPGETLWNTGRPVKMNRLLLCPAASSKFWSDEASGKVPVTQSAFITWGVFPYTTANTYMVHGACGSYGANAWAASIPNVVMYRDKYWQTIYVDGGENIPLLADCTAFGGRPLSNSMATLNPPEWDGHWYDGSLPSSGSAYSIARFVLNRHTEGSNCLFFDLSARKVGLKENWTLKWEQTFDTSNRWTKAGGVEPDDWPEWMRDFKEY